jgi:hypothetical protein
MKAGGAYGLARQAEVEARLQVYRECLVVFETELKATTPGDFKLAREIAARSEPRFIEIEPERRTTLRRTNDRLFIEVQRDRGGGRVPFTDEQLEAMRGGLTMEQYRRKTLRKW